MTQVVRVTTDTDEVQEFDGATGFDVAPHTGALLIHADEKLTAAYAPGRWASVIDCVQDD
ncbi:MAG: hypothetical protein ACI38U_03220 [Corynebacterium sp.]|uniref:hypothetical protein n=1 Tax=Corynebacterium sp. TaxID=1720 RepID=UPI003F06DA7B